MPAPLAKGLIIALSLLAAAGIAIYENPQVKEWIDDSRRKVETAFRDLSHELNGTAEDPPRCPRDRSTQEDDSPEAAERRRQARQEILERGRRLEERRRARQTTNESNSASFDDLVDKDGSLRAEASSTAAEPQAEVEGLRNRHTEAKAAALGSAVANPFADEMSMEPESDESGVRTPTFPTSPLASPPLPPKPAAYQPQALLINTNTSTSTKIAVSPDQRSETLSNHPSEQHIELTPTTSAAPSSFADDLASLTPNSTHPNGQRAASPALAQQSYWSVNEWAQQHSVTGPEAFYSPPQSDAGAGPPANDLERAMSEMISETESMAGDGERVSQVGTEDMDVMSDDDGPGISTPGSWTDVGSTVTEDL